MAHAGARCGFQCTSSTFMSPCMPLHTVAAIDARRGRAPGVAAVARRPGFAPGSPAPATPHATYGGSPLSVAMSTTKSGGHAPWSSTSPLCLIYAAYNSYL